MRELSHTVGERGYVGRPPPSATWAVRGRGGVPAGPGYPFITGWAPAVLKNTGVKRACKRGKFAGRAASLRGGQQGKSRRRALRCEVSPLARCCARCVRSRCSRARVPARIAMLSQCVAVVQVCSGVWQLASVVPLMLQSWAMLGTCDLCGAGRARTMGEP